MNSDPNAASKPAASNNLEVEVKFYVPDLAAFREALLRAGAKPHRARVFERNLRFDTADEALFHRGDLLRLRQDYDAVITFKGLTQEAEQSEAKIREELEIRVDNFEMAAAILNRLGFDTKQVYEKYRETFHLGEVEVVLDELPYGNFVELEGSEVDIKSAAAALDLDWNRRITLNYLGLMTMLKELHHLPFDDLTFANFEDLSLSITAVLA